MICIFNPKRVLLSCTFPYSECCSTSACKLVENPAIINRRENYLFPRPSGLYQLLCLFSRVCPRRLAVGSPCRTVQFRAGVLTRPRPPPLICALHARVTCPGSHTPPAASPPPPPSPFDVQVTGRKDVRTLTVEALWQRDETQTQTVLHMLM